MVRLIALAALVACSPRPGAPRAPLSADCPCECPPVPTSPDAAIDATPDATPLAYWPRHTITAGSSTLRGADGVHVVGDLIATAWEESGTVTVARRPADPREPWPTETIATGLLGAEDPRLADIDGDGALDVVTASDSGKRVYVSFAGGPTITIAASLGHNRIMQVAPADVDADGDTDILFGSRVGTAENPAVIAALLNPGAAARDGTAWTYQRISLAGWTMSVEPVDPDRDGDVDVLVTDRGYYTLPGSTARLWDLNGARWIEQTPDGWVNHRMGPQPPGDEMMASVFDIDGDGSRDVIDCQSAATKPNQIRILAGGWSTWTTTTVPDVPGVGHCQQAVAGDIDGDGVNDLVVSTWEVNALPTSTLIGVYWLRGPAYTWGGDISGPDGSKHDSIALRDLDGDGDMDVIGTEQVDNLGVIWWENTR